VLTRAVQHGTVSQLQKRNGQPWEELSANLVTELTRSGMAEEQARWAVDSWALALGQHPSTESAALAPARPAWAELPPSPQGAPQQSPRGALYHPTVGAVCGGLGAGIGTIGMMLIIIAIINEVADALPETMHEQGQGILLVMLIFTAINFLIGAVFGALGGGIGLFLAHSFAGETRGTLFFAKIGAFMGGMLGAAIGWRFCWPFGIILGSVMGGWLGAFSSAKGALVNRW
jgi:hypothetical protein